ncbi:MAG TPA: hypothetical protein VMT24_16770 [Aggregatilineaceae bacterium]|nr:hypothetical protein [Aggregatilineaceae bacterium]
METLDEPAVGVEGDDLLGLLKRFNRQGSQQQPVNGLLAVGWLGFKHLDHLNGQAVTRALGPLRAAQRQAANAHLHRSVLRVAVRPTFDRDGFLSHHRRKSNGREQFFPIDGKTPPAGHAHNEIQPGLQRRVQKLVAVRFPVTDGNPVRPHLPTGSFP